MTTPPLTEGQQAVFDFLQRYLSEHGYPPSEREIAGGLGTKWIRGIQRHLAALEQKGVIRRGKGARAIELAENGRSQGIPILGQIAAGKPILAEEHLIGTFSIDRVHRRWRDAFLLKVKGDSMKNAGILEGDYVLVKPQPEADSGEIVVALLQDEATVKRLVKRQKKILLQSENPAYPPIAIEPGNEIKVLGKVVGVFRLY